MQEITHNIALNLSQPNNFEYIHIMQGDYNAEKVIATLFDGNKLYTIDAQKASLQGSTSDGGLILQDGIAISADKHQVTFEITKEMSSCTGELTCNIVFSSDNQKKSTFPFIIKNTADITGRTPVSVLTTISDYVDRAEKAAKDSETNKVTTDENVTKATEQATIATIKATESANSAKEATEQANIATIKAKESTTSAQNSKEQADIATTKAQEASSSATASADSATQAGKSATIASEKASDAASNANSASTSATNASKSETNAKTSADSASLSATNASTSETNAQYYAIASSKSAQESATSEANAKQSATNAKASETSSSEYASSASISATTASEKADVAITKATESANSASDSLTYSNQSKDYRDQCKSIAQGLEGALLPKGTITFAELPTDDIKTGDMYNISDDFTSDNRFKDGVGKAYTAGTNIYYTSDGLWDVLIGDLEKYAFKTDLEDHVGDKSNPHDVTKAQVGLGDVPNVSTNNQTVTYTDSSTLTTLSSGEKMSVAFGKIKKAISDLISHISDTTKHITSSERTLWNTVNSKVDKVDGKGLSTNDYTTAEKTKLNGIESEANKTIVDSTLSSTSTNPVQNKVINDELVSKVDLSENGVNTAINKLSVGTDTPSDTDYYISQYAGGGTTTTSYHRRPVSALWSYIKNKADSVYSALGHNHTKSEVGLGNVDNTADANKSVKYATSAGSATSATKASCVADYGSPTNKTIQIGFGGDGISGDNIKYIAGYTTGNGSDVAAKIKDISKDNMKSWLGLDGKQDKGYYPTAGACDDGTIDDLYAQKQGTTGGVGSVYLTKKSDGVGSKIATGWYNYLYMPHRNGIGGDNLFFGSIFITPMTYSGTSYIIRCTESKVAEVKPIITSLPSSLPASDVYSWAKASSKPSYTASEVGAAAANHTHDYLPLSGGTVNGSITFGKSDSYGIFTSTDNYGSIGSSSKYFYKSYIKNVYANDFIIDNHFSLRPSSSATTNSEYTDVSNSAWIHGLDSDDYHGSKKPGLLLRQGSNFFQVFPTSNNSSTSTDIGHSSYRFRNIVGRTLYSDSGTVSTSDRNLKHDITNLSDEIVEKIVDGLIPKSFKFNDGDSGRTHYGIIAQELEELLISIGIDPNDFAPLVKVWEDKLIQTERNIIGKDGKLQTITEETIEKDTDKEPTYHVRYEEFIMILVQYCQNLKKKNTDLEDKYNELTFTVNEILKKLN